MRRVENLNKQILYDTNAFYGLDIEGDRVNVFGGLQPPVRRTAPGARPPQRPVSPTAPNPTGDWLVTESLIMEVPFILISLNS